MRYTINSLRVAVAVMLVAMCAAVFSDPAAGRRRRAKARTTQTTKKRSTKSSKRSKSKKSATSRKRRATTSAASQQEYSLPSTRPAANDISTRSSSSRAAASPKRKINVEKPDLGKIRAATLNPSDPMYFPRLMEKYQRNDTTMTAEEYRNFYLGYMFQEDYDPYRTSPYSGVTDELRSKTSHSKEEIDTIRKYAELTLRDNPFDLRQMSFLVHVLKEKRKDMTAKIWEYRLEHLLGAIKSTGTGETADNAWYVIYPMHEYDMVQLLGYEATDADFLDPGIDYLTVVPDETQKRRGDPAKGFYFNVVVPQEQYVLKHPEEQSETEVTPGDSDAEAGALTQGTVEPDDIPAQ